MKRKNSLSDAAMALKLNLNARLKRNKAAYILLVTKVYGPLKRGIFPKITLWVEPTNVCNFKCEQCFNRLMTRTKGFMPLADYKKYVIDQNLPILDTVSFTGWGEPLLHPDIFAIIEYTAKNGINL